MNTRMSLAILLAAVAASASAQTFTFGKQKPEQQLATVESKTSIETFVGTTSTLAGTVNINVKKKTVSGFITVDGTTIKTKLPLRDEHMQGEQWLDTKKQPLLKFTIKSAKLVSGDNYTVNGEFSMRGQSKPVTVPVTAKLIKANAVTAKAGFKGDVLHFDTTFPIKLSDYGIVISGPAAGKVSNEVTIHVSAFGTTK